MKVTVCIGSSCHIKGSRQIVEQLQELIRDNNLNKEIELAGAFCMGNCERGVSVKVDDQQFSLTPEKTREFFEKNILSRGK